MKSLFARVMRLAPTAAAWIGGFTVASRIADSVQSTSARWVWPKKPLVLGSSRQGTVSCDIGTVWITQGDGRDYVLMAGEQVTLHPADDVIIAAMVSPALVRHVSHHLPQSLLQEQETVMNELTLRERELVALGAAMGSNCVPCIERHISLARTLGLNNLEIREAIELADQVRQAPARTVLAVANQVLEGISEKRGQLPESAQCSNLGKPASQCC